MIGGKTDLIEENWDDILRLIATIKLKEVTASELFRRLNSYSKQHALYRALKAFGKIIKSHFILRYIDDVELRQAIERQLNRIEQAHHFTRAVSVGNPREFIPAEKQEQEIAEGCKRLIKSCIPAGTTFTYGRNNPKRGRLPQSARRRRPVQNHPVARPDKAGPAGFLG